MASLARRSRAPPRRGFPADRPSSRPVQRQTQLGTPTTIRTLQRSPRSCHVPASSRRQFSLSQASGGYTGSARCRSQGTPPVLVVQVDGVQRRRHRRGRLERTLFASFPSVTGQGATVPGEVGELFLFDVFPAIQAVEQFPKAAPSPGSAAGATPSEPMRLVF